MLFIKSRQISRQKSFDWGLTLNLDSSLTEAVSIENYVIRISRSNFTHIYEYLCRVSFLTTLDIYKDYFKGHLKWCNLMQSHCACKLWPETKFSLVHHILCRSYYAFTPRDFVTKELPDLHYWWIEEFCSQHLSQVGVLVTYWNPCIIG